MSRRIILIRHGDDPPDDRVHTWLATRGFAPEVRRPYAGELLGEVDGSVAGSVVYGGKYNAYDVEAHPFLAEEYRWIGACIAAGVPLLGICQGAQMIAHHHGAAVGPAPGNPHEFGYYEIRPTAAGRDVLPGPLHVVQSHFHTFDLPDGAELLASSDLFPNQAFRIGDRVYGLQFHAEVTIEGFRRWQNSQHAAYGRPGAQSRAAQDELMLRHDAAQAGWFYGFLEKLFGGSP